MGKRAKFKFVVGDTERQSEVWTVIITKSDVYLTTSGGKHTKISLHESGQGNWSLQYESLTEAPFVPAGGRHLAQWNTLDGTRGPMREWFFLLLADSELRQGRPSNEGKAIRIPAPGAMRAVKVVLAITEPLPGPPEEHSVFVQAPIMYLFSHQLTNGRVVVAVWREVPLPPTVKQNMDKVRALAWDTAKSQGLDPVGTKATIRVTDEHGVTGFVEVAPYSGIL
ncbi:hypothetical protein [Rhodanobacter denitrificans]|uniref:hypothetical protein n=1 Tax=Rhodanobacter denitrificans TaxID=666685 RepID=UPI0012FDA1FC|nr:hypothetical protein [Rhodanobacter denitrificans]UJM85509.1 hypothetical protein LRJ86_12060 [Rhodanobacter denitrificans]